MKDLTLTVHYINEYLNRIWGANTPASDTLTDNTDIMSDLESEYYEAESTAKTGAEAQIQKVDVHSRSSVSEDSFCDRRNNELSLKTIPAHNEIQHFAGKFALSYQYWHVDIKIWSPCMSCFNN